MENIGYVASNIANVTANVAANMVANVATPSRSSSVIWWIVGILVVLGAIGYALYVKLGASPAPAPVPQPEEIVTGQTWCFVGEDVAGRHCVQVPSTASCDPERTFTSRLACGTASP